MPPPPRPPKGGKKPWLKGQTDDLASLAELDETILLAELESRYSADKIYTYVGDILVAVNPFKALGIYSKDVANKYHNAVKSTNTPHIFAIADQAYHNMKKSGKNQCAVVSGESGAGKTESAKYMIKQIIDLSHTPEGATLEKKIIQVNPLLEAFGNAQTVMNNNSSRFGKYTQLMFDSRGSVKGSKISEYLLEKSRVVSQGDGERSFHVFYYMFASADAAANGLTDTKSFKYLARSSIQPNNAAMYAELEVAMKDVGFSSDDQLNMWAAMAGILHMGNVEFGGGADSSSVASSPALVSKVAELLGLDPKALEDGFLVSKSITRGETIVKHHSKERAYDVRDALNKQIYGRLFGWIVQRINYLLGSEDEGSSREVETSIGILDIFGFENFNVNGFEQLCINVTNEQLQNFFNQHIFQNELEEYRREGVDATKISFVDNGPLLDMFFSKMGMFKILDEESHFPRATDKSLVIKYNANLKSKAPMYRPHKMDDMIFTVAHYAGDVDYTSMSFLERNRDTLSQALVECCQDSTNSIVKEIFLSSVSETGALVVAERTRGGQALSQRRMSLASKKSPTVGAQFTLSLKVLIDTMLACAAHFVRCIKPNTTQSANKFTDNFVNRQLSYTGMLETCRIRREGYSYRPRFDDFMERFGLLAFASQGIDASRSTCEKVMAVSQLKGWLIGRSKVFLKYWHVEALDKQLLRFENAAVTVQSWGRRYLAQLFYRRLLAQSQQELKTAASFMQGIPRQANGVLSKLAKQNDADSRRKVLPKSNVQAPPPMPELSEAELKRQQSISWFQSKELPKGAGQAADGTVLPWFHGLISRKDAETLLSKREVGCFLVRVSETRFGYTLSYRIRTRCRHYMVEQDRRGRYALVGVEKICNSLNELINWFQRNQINDEGEMLREACGQEVNEFGEEECDFEELYGTVDMPTSRGGGGGGGPPAVMRSAKPGQSSGAAPPAINRKAKPSAHGGAPPSISRSSKPRK